jgi:hypothetical protein
LPSDRRKYKRYVPRKGALVCPVAGHRKYWKMLDVSMGGASFRYASHEDMTCFEQIDIVMEDLDFVQEVYPSKRYRTASLQTLFFRAQS